MQLTDTIGAIKLAERVPDMYVMAPQAPAGGLSMEEMFAKMCFAPGTAINAKLKETIVSILRKEIRE